MPADRRSRIRKVDSPRSAARFPPGGMPADRRSRIRGIPIGGESLQIGIAGFVASLWDRSLIAEAAMLAWPCKGLTHDSI